METKESRLITSKREAYKIAAEKCEYYLSTIIPLQNKLNDEIREKNITFFENSHVTIEGEKVKATKTYKSKQELDLVWNLTYSLDVFNLMESFSVFFVNGIAEESVAFLAVGSTFCFSARKYLPHIITLSSDGSYSNIMKLYLLWAKRIEKTKLESERAKIESQLLNTKSDSLKVIGLE